MDNLIYKDESFQIIGVCMEVFNIIGRGFLEIVYKDALEYEFKKKNISYEREKEFLIEYKDIILAHKFYADFTVWDKMILEIKCASGIADEHIKQTLNYLAVSKYKLGVIINFGEESLRYKRVVL
ncbi:MAG: GxxExxY protein [bacterium]